MLFPASLAGFDYIIMNMKSEMQALAVALTSTANVLECADKSIITKVYIE